MVRTIKQPNLSNVTNIYHYSGFLHIRTSVASLTVKSRVVLILVIRSIQTSLI